MIERWDLVIMGLLWFIIGYGVAWWQFVRSESAKRFKAMQERHDKMRDRIDAEMEEGRKRMRR